MFPVLLPKSQRDLKLCFRIEAVDLRGKWKYGIYVTLGNLGYSLDQADLLSQLEQIMEGTPTELEAFSWKRE